MWQQCHGIAPAAALIAHHTALMGIKPAVRPFVRDNDTRPARWRDHAGADGKIINITQALHTDPAPSYL